MKIGKKNVLAVDVGTTKIRVCSISEANMLPTLAYYDEIEMPVIPEEREKFFRTEGKEFIKRQPARAFYASLPGKGILSRVITVPKVPVKKLKEILRYEVQQQIPFPLEMVEWEYQILSETPQNFNILLAAVKKDLINDFLTRLHILGINTVSLFSDLFALINSFHFSSKTDMDKCQGILDIGANSANLIILHKEKILLRSLTTSGDSITNAIIESENISFQEAERRKIEEAFNIPVVASTVENLNTEIQNSIDYWRFTLKGPELDSISLAGRGTLLKNFREVLEEKSRLKVVYFDPLDDIKLPADLENMKELSVEHPVLMGVGLGSMRLGYVDINLLPVEVEQVKVLQANKVYISLAAVMAVLIAITPSIFLNQDKVMLDGILTEIDISLRDYEQYKPEVDSLQREIDSLKGRTNKAKDIVEQKSIWLERIADVGSVLPSSRVYLTNFLPGEVEAAARVVPAVQPGMPMDMYQGDMPPGGGPPPGMPMETYPGDMPPGGGPPPGMPPDAYQGGEMYMDTGMGMGEPYADTSADVTVQAQNVFTLFGEIAMTDIRTAFSDFRLFVSDLKELDFISDVSIRRFDVDEIRNKLDFALVVNIQ